MWAVGGIVVVILALIACLGFCIYKKCFNKGKKPKKVRERKGGRGRRKKDKDGEDGDDKKVRRDHTVLCWYEYELLGKSAKFGLHFPDHI